MVEAADLRDGNDPTLLGCLNRTRHGSTATERSMTADQVIVVQVARDDSPEMGFVNHDEVVQTVPADRSDHALHEWILPRALRRDEHFLDSYSAHAASEGISIGAIPIAEQVTGCLVKREGLAELLNDPSRGRVGRDVEMHNPPSLVAKDDPDVQDLKEHSGHREEVHGGDILDVVLQERAPGLGRRLTASVHVPGNGGCSQIIAEQVQLRPDVRSVPKWVFPSHPTNELAKFTRDFRSALL
jgi:hypothetical protein